MFVFYKCVNLLTKLVYLKQMSVGSFNLCYFSLFYSIQLNSWLFSVELSLARVKLGDNAIKFTSLMQVKPDSSQ